MIDATRHLPVIAALEAAIPDTSALVFAPDLPGPAAIVAVGLRRQGHPGHRRRAR